MGDVYLLGAGFSKAISDEMPLLSELSGQIKARGLDLPSHLTTLGDNLEVWLSYLSQPHPWLRESMNLKNQAMALEISELIKEVLDEKERLAIGKDCPSWLQKLTKAWHETKAGVISLNYDTLVERAAAMISTGENEHLSADQLYPVQLTISTRSESEYCLTGAAGKPRSLDVNHSCRSSMVSHRCSLNPVTFSTGLGTLGACG